MRVTVPHRALTAHGEWPRFKSLPSPPSSKSRASADWTTWLATPESAEGAFGKFPRPRDSNRTLRPRYFSNHSCQPPLLCPSRFAYPREGIHGRVARGGGYNRGIRTRQVSGQFTARISGTSCVTVGGEIAKVGDEGVS